MSVTITKRVQFNGGSRGRKRLEEATPQPDVPAGRSPRISRLMALAIKMDRWVREGHVRDYAELGRVGHVSRARVTQIMNLNFLAPDIQEDLLFLPRVERGRDPIREHAIRPIAAMFDWRKQRKVWRKFASQPTGPRSGEWASLGVAGENTFRLARCTMVHMAKRILS